MSSIIHFNSGATFQQIPQTTSLGKQLLKTTSRDLEKKVVLHNWKAYLQETYFPELEKKMRILHENDPFFQNFIKNKFEKYKSTIADHLCQISNDRSISILLDSFFEFNTLDLDAIEQDPISLHLQHLLIERLASISSSSDSQFFMVPNPHDEKIKMAFWKDKKNWIILTSVAEENKSTILGTKKHRLLLNENLQIHQNKAINLAFLINTKEEKNWRVKENIAKGQAFNLKEVDVIVEFTLYLGAPKSNSEEKNYLSLSVRIVDGALDEKSWTIFTDETCDFLYLKKAKEMIRAAIQTFLDDAVNTFSTHLRHNELILFPTCIEEDNQSFIEILRSAQANPEENIEIIELLALERDLSFTQEELNQATKQTNAEEIHLLAEENVEISPAIIAQVMINRLEASLPLQEESKAIEANSKATGPSPDELKVKENQKNLRRKEYLKKERKIHQNELDRIKKDNPLEPLTLKLKPKESIEVKKVLEEKISLNKRRFNSLAQTILKTKARNANVDIRTRGAHPKIHVKSTKKGSWGVTLSNTHGKDPNNGPALHHQRRTLLQILES